MPTCAASPRGERFASVAREMDAIVDKGYVIIGSPDEVAEQLREVATNLNVGHLMLLLQFGNMSKDLAKYNTQAVRREGDAEAEGHVRRMGGPLVAAADGERRSARDSARLPCRQLRRGVRLTGACRERTRDADRRGQRLFHAASGARAAARSSAFSPALAGLPRWVPFLDALAEEPHGDRAVAAGFPGGDRGHTVLDSISTGCWRCAQLLDKAGLDGADLAGSSVGGSLAAEMAALWPDAVRRLALIAPFGLFDENDPPTDPWAQRGDAVPGLMCADPEIWKALKAAPEGANSIEWPIEQTRANEAAARIFWPLGNTKLEKRLPLIEAPTLLLWGEQDRIMPRSYAERFAKGIARQDRDQGDPRRRPSRRTRQARRGRRRDPRLDAS